MICLMGNYRRIPYTTLTAENAGVCCHVTTEVLTLLLLSGGAVHAQLVSLFVCTIHFLRFLVPMVYYFMMF